MAKKLYRSKQKKMLGGICGGLADYFDIDVSLVRLIFVALALITAVIPMLLFYIIAWIVVPEEEETAVASAKRKTKKNPKSS